MCKDIKSWRYKTSLYEMCGLFFLSFCRSMSLSKERRCQENFSQSTLQPQFDRSNELDCVSIFSFVIIQIASLAFIDRVAFFDKGINAFAVIGTIENL